MAKKKAAKKAPKGAKKKATKKVAKKKAPKKAAKKAGGSKRRGGGAAFMRPVTPDDALGAVVGAEPVGATNNLNFGNPERPEIMAQLVEAIEGIADACRHFDVPITGGNVSLYNETLGDVDRAIRLDRSDARELLLQIAAAEELHGDVGAPVVRRAEIEHVHEVRMAKRRETYDSSGDESLVSRRIVRREETKRGVATVVEIVS